MVMMMLLSSHKKAMGKFRLPVGLKAVGWLATGVMAVASVGMIATASW
jgi:Mn2+/Fe2+ NRAMP family transporter